MLGHWKEEPEPWNRDIWMNLEAEYLETLETLSRYKQMKFIRTLLELES